MDDNQSKDFKLFFGTQLVNVILSVMPPPDCIPYFNSLPSHSLLLPQSGTVPITRVTSCSPAAELRS